MIIGLHGRMGAGKNECARRLAFLSDQTVVEVSFAAKLKQSAAALLGVDVAELEEWKNNQGAFVLVESIRLPAFGVTEHSIQTVRSFLQRYGTEAHRDIFGADFWLDAALPHHPLGILSPYGDALYVVTDVRFPNEAQRVRELGGVVVQVIGPDTDTGTHASEQPLECDHTIRNVVRDDGFLSLDERLGYLLRIVGDPAWQIAA